MLNMEKHPLKYVDELSNAVSEYVELLVKEIYSGIAFNMGIQKYQPSLSRPVQITKAKDSSRMIKILTRKIKKLNIAGINIYQRGKLLTPKQWESIEKQVVHYLRPYLSNLHEEITIKSILLALYTAEEENRRKSVREFGKKSYEQIVNERFSGFIPNNLKSARDRNLIGQEQERAFISGYEHAAQYIYRLEDEIKSAIRIQVGEAHRGGKTPAQLGSDLYWQKDDNPELKLYTAEFIIRDWQRVAITETATIYEAGKMAVNEMQARESLNDSSKAIYYVFIHGSCEWCNAHHGTIVRHIPLEIVGNTGDDLLSSRGISDPFTDIAVWQGKSNFGFKQTQWRICTPPHPNGTATLTRFFPAEQKYDHKTGIVQLKDNDFDKYFKKWDDDIAKLHQRNIDEKLT